jgi:hypothetical protein
MSKADIGGLRAMWSESTEQTLIGLGAAFAAPILLWQSHVCHPLQGGR